VLTNYGCGLGRIFGETAGSGGDEVCLDRIPSLRRVSQQVDVHLICTAFGALMPEMCTIEVFGIIFRLTKEKRSAPTFIVAADENVICPRYGRASNQAVNQMKVWLTRSATPIVEGVGEVYLGIDACRLMRRSPRGRFNVSFVRPHVPSRHEGVTQ
jgi:hypothetical protein